MKQTAENTGNFLGKKIVIVGGSSGIGLSVAKAAALKLAEVIIISSNQQRINAALKELPASSSGFAVDVTNEAQLKSTFEKIGTFHHLVFTAGESIKIATMNEMGTAEAKAYFNVRYWGAFAAIKHASPHIDPSGSIVLTSGIAANRPGKGWVLGASICSAMEGLTRAMALELAPIRVNSVSPGVVKTDLWSSLPEADREAMYTHMGNTLPVQRVGTGSDLAQTYVYLMEQGYSTGQTVIVDGGLSLI